MWVVVLLSAAIGSIKTELVKIYVNNLDKSIIETEIAPSMPLALSPTRTTLSKCWKAI
jgi:hypothetical protein